MEVIGYIGRAINAQQYPAPKLGPYIIQALLLLLPPTFFAAVIYATLGRLVRSVNGQFACPIKSTWLTPIFVTGDVFVFLLQASGGGLMTQAGRFQTGQYLVLAGIVLQMIWFGIFVVVALIWHLRMRAACLSTSSRTGSSTAFGWSKDLWVLYAVSVCIIVRSIYRTVDYAGGYDGYVMTHEWFLYVFDGLFMLLASVLYTIWPPVQVKKQSTDVQLLHSHDKSQSSDIDVERLGVYSHK